MSQIKKAFSEHRRLLLAYIAKYALQPADIDDIMQETFAQTLEASRKDVINAPKSYLFIVARNLIFRHLRNQSKHMMEEIGEIDESELESSDLSIEKTVHNSNKMKAVLVAADSLPAQCRRVFLMRKFYGMSHKQIAAELRISTSTVERHITNALKRCRATMQRKGYNLNETSAVNELSVRRIK